MAVETQQSIGQWARETFPGGEPMKARYGLRLLEEVVELCRAMGASPKEIHDTVYSGLPGGWDWLIRANEPHHKVEEEFADVNITLKVAAEMWYADLDSKTDAKMAVNRARRWKANGDGTGYHIKDPA